jgi:hypothetical protein
MGCSNSRRRCGAQQQEEARVPPKKQAVARGVSGVAHGRRNSMYGRPDTWVCPEV